jgi:hypothetical protein
MVMRMTKHDNIDLIINIALGISLIAGGCAAIVAGVVVINVVAKMVGVL